MTEAQLFEMLSKIELHAPITMGDLRELFDAIKPQLAASMSLDVTLAKDGRVMVVVGAGGPKPYTLALNVIA